MFFETIQQFHKMLTGFSAICDKAARYAEGRKFDPNNYLTARLAPDMFPLLRQVQSACDAAKNGAARLSGQDAPVHEDNEKTFADVKERVHKCAAYLATFKPEHFHGAAERHITLPFMPDKYFLGKDYLIEFAVPNFYFHLTTAYDLLRHAGADIGKQDFLTSMKLHNK